MRTPRLGLVLPDPPVQSLPRLVETLWRAFLRLDSGTSGGVVTLDGTETLTNKTLTAPVVADFVNAQHAHTAAGSGGTLTFAALTVPRAHVTHSVAQSIPNATLTALAFNTEREDIGAWHDNVTNNTRLTVPVTGTYLITAAVRWATNGTGRRVLQVIRNAGVALRVVSQTALAATETQQALAFTFPLVAGDFLETIAFQDSTVALDVQATANESPEFSAVRVA